MEVHLRVNCAIAKRLWNVLRVTFFMIRKGLVSKRKLIMDMNLFMKRGKLLRKSVTNFITHHHHSSRHVLRGRYGIQEYEFSCSNSPSPVFFHVSKRNKHHYFPCINLPHEIEEETDSYDLDNRMAVVMAAAVPKTPEYIYNNDEDQEEVCQGDDQKLISPLLLSPFSIRVSNYSSEDEDGVVFNGGNEQVDDRAEEFITRFYEQLRAQSRMQLLQYT